MKRPLFTLLSEKELQAYQAISRVRTASVSEIARQAGLKRTTVYNFIDGLVEKGLIGRKLINNRNCYYPFQKELTLYSAHLAELKEKKIAQSFDNFQFFTNKQLVRKLILATLEAKDKKVDWMVDSSSTTDILGNRFFEDYIREVNKKRIQARILRSPVSKGTHRYHDIPAIKKMKRIIRLGQSTIPFHTSFAIAENKVIILSPEGFCYLISDQKIADSFKNIFEGLWKYSKPLGEEAYLY